MLSLGPFPMTAVLVLLALAAAIGVFRILQVQAVEGTRTSAWQLLDLLVIAVLLARLAFVLRWWPLYAQAPAAALMIQDGGFVPAAGIVGALAWAFWKTRAQLARRRALLSAAVVGVLIWLAMSAGLREFQQRTLRIPELTLSDLQGQPRKLQDLAGKPVVINLWASWCPPCRREMPVLAAAQRDYPQLQFVFLNQGESAEAVQAYLTGSGLKLDKVWLDSQAAMGQAILTRALPATLVFDANGQLLDTHLGALSAPGLAAKLSPLRE